MSNTIKQIAILIVCSVLIQTSIVNADLKGVEKKQEGELKAIKSEPDNIKPSKKAPVINKMPTNTEQEWLQEIGDSISVGKKVMISLFASDGTEKKQKYLAFYAKQNLLDERGTIIILHDKESHPDWKNIIRPLRTELPDTGWNTLSLQLPILDKQVASFEELDRFYKKSYERINGAIFYLNSQKARNVMVVAYGSSAMSALSYISNQSKLTSLRLPVAAVSAIALISPYSVAEEKFIDQELNLFELIQIPTLDLYGADDLDIVKKYAKTRKSIARRSGNRRYMQQKIANADHFYMGQAETVVKRIHSFFLSVLVPPFQIKRPFGQYLYEIR
ncbi:MAG: DUF3530 family protein [Gammaproteobacteria bacterium]|nr:DUF3530 family protein [Gammaproteobacteria bacterium]